MRYIKVLLVAIFIFLVMVFFVQNQAPLSQEAEYTLNLFFIPPMKSIMLPFYFIVIAAFLIGCCMTVAFLLWEKFNNSARLMKAKWQVTNLSRELAKQKKQYDKAQEEIASLKMPATPPAQVMPQK